MKTNWDKSDMEMFKIIPEEGSLHDYTLAESFSRGVEGAVSSMKGDVTYYKGNSLNIALARLVDESIERHLSNYDGYIGEFPDPVTTAGKITNTTYSAGDAYKSTTKVTLDFFRDWRYLPEDMEWDRVGAEGWPGGRLYDTVQIAYTIFNLRAPFRYALRKVLQYLLRLLYVAVFFLFLCNEFWAWGLARDNAGLPPAGSLGKIRIFDAIRNAIPSIPLLKNVEARFPGAIWFVLGLFLGFLCYKLFKSVVDISERGDFFGPTADLVFAVGFPLFFAIYPYVLIMVPFFALCLALAVAALYTLADLLPWVLKMLTRIFPKKKDKEKIRELTAQFDHDAFILHRYARLRILWAKEKNGGKYPKELNKFDKKLKKADRLVRRYGISA